MDDKMGVYLPSAEAVKKALLSRQFNKVNVGASRNVAADIYYKVFGENNENDEKEEEEVQKVREQKGKKGEEGGEGDEVEEEPKCSTRQKVILVMGISANGDL